MCVCENWCGRWKLILSCLFIQFQLLYSSMSTSMMNLFTCIYEKLKNNDLESCGYKVKCHNYVDFFVDIKIHTHIITENKKFIMQTPFCTRLIKDCQKKIFPQNISSQFFINISSVQNSIAAAPKRWNPIFFSFSQQHLNSLVNDEARMMMVMKKRRSKEKNVKLFLQ